MHAVISVSLEPELILKAKKSVERGEAHNVSDVIRKSLEKYLEK